MASTAAPALVISHADGEAPATTGIFTGLSFFLVQRLPSRSSFVNKIQSNGGRVVKIEKQADHIIADHVKPVNCPPGSISYTFIDKALHDGALPNAAEYLAGTPKGTVRPAATAFPTKGTRTPFTAEDDRELYIWVKRQEAKGASVKGNELYKELERRNNRHTYQAWRDRYVKRLHDQPPPGVDIEAILAGGDNGADANLAFPRPTQRKNGNHSAQPRGSPGVVVGNEKYALNAVERLIDMGDDVENIQEGRVEEAWDAYANRWPEHSAESWRRLWDEYGRAEYLKRKEIGTAQEAGAVSANPPDIDGASNVQREEVGDSTSAPDRPRSSGPLKRKRDTPNSHRQATHSVKKHMHGSGIFRDADSNNGHATDDQPAATTHANLSTDEPLHNENAETTAGSGIERSRQTPALPTSEANKAAAMQLDVEVSKSVAKPMPPNIEREQLNAQQHGEGSTDDTLITGDANRVAAMQLDDDHARLLDEPTSQASQEVDPRRNANKSGITTDETALPTSELNRFADQQLRRESMESGPTFGRLNEHASDRETMLHSEAIESQVGDDNPSDLVPEQGNALMEANLATQEELQREPIVRGQDLPQDDNMHDQGDYVQYLQSLQPAAAEQGMRSGLKSVAQDAVLSATQDLGPNIGISEAVSQSQDEQLFREDIPEPPLDDLPLSSQQELDHIMNATLHWPESPGATDAGQAAREETPERNVQFETQIEYPRLPLQQYAPSISALETSETVQYPDLNNANKQTQKRSYQEELQARFDREVLGLGPLDGRQPDRDGEDDGIFIDIRGKVDEAEEIDLELPEPEGGFGFSSSQPLTSQQPHEAETPDQRRGLKRETRDNRLLVMPTIAASNTRKLGLDDAFNFTSSPPTASQRAYAAKSAEHEQSVDPLSDVHEAADDNATPRNATAAIEITSSSSSSSFDVEHENEREEDIPQDYPRALETQDIYNAKTQAPDFDMPSPDMNPAVQTQDFYNAAHPFPGFDMPSPGGSFEDGDISSSPPKPTTTVQESQAALADSQALSDDEVEDYINRMVFIEKYTERAVIDALKSTSNRPELADLVLLDGRAGKGLPIDVPGIWSAEDDKVLEGGNAKALRVLEERHGWTECKARLMWLEECREYDEDEE